MRVAITTTTVAAGFTLLELMLILWVLMLVAIYRYPAMQAHWERRATERTAAGLHLLAEAARHYRQTHDHWPVSLESAAQALQVGASVHNYNGFGYPYDFDVGADGTQLSVVTQTGTPHQSLSICKRHKGILCEDNRLRLPVRVGSARSGDDLVADLASGSVTDLDAHDQFILNVSSINSEDPNTLDFRVPGVLDGSRLFLLSIDAREVIADDVVSMLADDLDATHNRWMNSSNWGTNWLRRSVITTFPQSRYPYPWPQDAYPQPPYTTPWP